MGIIILFLTALVFIIVCRTGADLPTSGSRAMSVLFYSLISLQLIAQIGEQATGERKRSEESELCCCCSFLIFFLLLPSLTPTLQVSNIQLFSNFTGGYQFYPPSTLLNQCLQNVCQYHIFGLI